MPHQKLVPVRIRGVSICECTGIQKNSHMGSPRTHNEIVRIWGLTYMSPDPFFDSFEEELDLCKWSFDKHRTAGLSLVVHNGCLYLGVMTPSTLGAKVDR